MYFNAIDILGAYGLTENDIVPTYQSFGDSANDIKDGKIAIDNNYDNLASTENLTLNIVG